MKKIFFLVIMGVFSCSREDNKKPAVQEEQNQDLIAGACNFHTLLGGNNPDTLANITFAYVCRSGSEQENKKWCQDVGTYHDKKGKYLKFIPNASCNTKDATAFCRGDNNQIIAVYEKPLYDMIAVKKALKDFCSEDNLKYQEN